MKLSEKRLLKLREKLATFTTAHLQDALNVITIMEREGIEKKELKEFLRTPIDEIWDHHFDQAGYKNMTEHKDKKP